jgi:ABC-2 type transport system permease protein
MWQLLRIELYKIFRKPRTYISFATVLAITLLVQVALLANGQEFSDFILQGVNAQFDLQGKILNGYFVTYLILGMLLVHVPLLVALVAGDALAGESAAGTLRLVLTKPVSRAKLVIGKYLATVVYSVALLVWLALIGLFASLLMFGEGDLIIAKSYEVVVLLRSDVMWRYICAFGFAALAMMAVAALSVFLSVLSENPIGPIVGTMGVVIVLTIISNLDLPIFSVIKPGLLTTHMLGWKGFFSDPVPYSAIGRSAAVLGGYIVALVGATIFVFSRKDIQS